jgi:hypothetical protein
MQSRSTLSGFELIEMHNGPAGYQSKKAKGALPAQVVQPAQASWLREQLRQTLLSSAQFLKGLPEQAWLPTTCLQELAVTCSQSQHTSEMQTMRQV